MGKLKHIRIDNLSYLTGLPEAVAHTYAKLLDGCVDGAMAQVPSFREWRRGASHDRLSYGSRNFSFHGLQLGGKEGRPGALVMAEASDTQGGFGEPRRGAYIYLWSQMGEEQQSLMSIPLVYLLRDLGPIEGLYTLYEHGAVDYNGTVADTFQAAVNERIVHRRMFPTPTEPHGVNTMLYIGVTSRSWGVRFKEHLDEARAGSFRPFHRALRSDFGRFNTRFHYVLAMSADKESAFASEERFVSVRDCVYPKGLNAIPGGYEGLRYLAKMNALAQLGVSRPNRVRLPEADGGVEIEVDPGRAEELLEAHMRRRASTSGLPIPSDPGQNESLAALWGDPEFAERMITSRGDRLSIEQVRLARYEQLLGRSPADIATSVGARDVSVIQRLIDGKTYARVRNASS